MRDKLITFSSENNSITKKDICNHIIDILGVSSGCVALLITYSWRENGYKISYIDLTEIDWFYAFIYGFIGYNVRTFTKFFLHRYVQKKIKK